MEKREFKLAENKIVVQDLYGNKVTITPKKDGSFEKVTQTNNQSNFIFMGQTYSDGILYTSKTEKVYWTGEHSERKLVKDMYGRLFHYRYDEEMRFDGPDREDILWTFVESEEKSDELAECSGLFILNPPFIAGNETGWMCAHENVDQKYLDELLAPPQQPPISLFKKIISILKSH